MDVTAIPTQHAQQTDPAVLMAGLIALAMGMMELVKTIFTWVSRKLYGKHEGDQVLVHLDPEVSRAIRETAKNMEEVLHVVTRVDLDGTPMVYTSRSGNEHLRAVVEVIRDIQRSQERLVTALEKLDGRFDDHDREERITHGRMQDTLEAMKK